MQAALGESTIIRDKFSYFELHGQNQELLYPKLNDYGYNSEKNLNKAVVYLLFTKYVQKLIEICKF